MGYGGKSVLEEGEGVVTVFVVVKKVEEGGVDIEVVGEDVVEFGLGAGEAQSSRHGGGSIALGTNPT